MEDFKEPQAMSDEQKLRDLQQRIIAKSENLIKHLQTEGGEGKHQWLGIAFLVFVVALIVAYIVYDYFTNDLGPFDVWIGGCVAGCLIAYYIMNKVMRHFLSRMKNANRTSQFYQDVKRLITTHKLRCWIPYAVGFICGYFAMIELASTNSNSTWPLIIINILWILCTIVGAAMRSWYLDDDFRYGVEELGEHR